jgi:hypothetical protein
MNRVIVHHAHHPDEGDGIYRLVHAEREEVVVQELVESEPERKVVSVLNPAYVPVPTEEEDNRTDEEKEVIIEQEVEIPVEPQLVDRVEVIEYDHSEIVWDAADKRWEGKSDQEIADLQREDVRKVLAKAEAAAKKEEKAATRREKSTKHFDGVGDAL